VHRRRIAGINGVSACELELVELVLIRTRLNLDQQVTLMHLLVVDHRQLEDWTAQVRRDPNRVGAHLRVIGVGTEVDVKRTNQADTADVGRCIDRRDKRGS
jgi:hypothetical protein